MEPFVELRMFTITEQIATIQPDETSTGLVLITQEINDKNESSRLYLTFNEAKELASSLEQMINRVKK
jgi:hypothetical protein